MIGAGAFGRHHLRVIGESARAELVGVVDLDAGRRAQAARDFGCPALEDWHELAGKADAAVVAVPTIAHAEVGRGLLEAGLDILVEKPIAASGTEARLLIEAAAANGRLLQVGHLERFNPAVMALERVCRLPLFFEIHRLSPFTPRSLDVDVVLDLMIHDVDIVLALVGQPPEEIRAAGLNVLTDKVDIANARLAFPGGCVANFTASRVSTERVRKLRLFQPHEYISIDYGRQDGVICSIGPSREIAFQPLAAEKSEPLKLQFEAFLDAIHMRRRPRVDGEAATAALEVALAILDRIKVHARVVEAAIAAL